MLTPAAAAAAAAAEEEEEEEEEAAGSAPVTCHGAFNKAFSASLDHLLQVTLLIFGFENKKFTDRSLERWSVRRGLRTACTKNQNKRGWGL